jgi:LmbE family N-acetylglucosaminyl deacetylase
VTTRLAGVFAHPDDDAYLIGGSLLMRPGEIDLTVVFATSGEAGPITDESLATRATLGEVREREQRAYLHAIGMPDARVEFLRHPDYYLPEVPMATLVEEIEAVLRDVRPHVVVTFGPDGLTSHPDHVYVGEAASEAFQRARSSDPGTAYLRLYHAALARSDVDLFYREVVDGGFDYGEEGRLFDVTGVPDESIAVRVDTRPVRQRKLAAILEHRTQLIEHERVPEPLRWIHLDKECFVQAYPPRALGERVREDLLDGLATTPDSSPES